MKYLIVLLGLFSCHFSNAQKVPVPQIENPQEVPDVPVEPDTTEEIMDIVEVQPEFPGGELAMMTYIKKNINYPEMSKEAGVQGTVYIDFIIDKAGNVTNVRILRGVAPDLDAEAKRVIKLMPNWKAGTQAGKPVNVRFVLPIKFGLN